MRFFSNVYNSEIKTRIASIPLQSEFTFQHVISVPLCLKCVTKQKCDLFVLILCNSNANAID